MIIYKGLVIDDRGSAYDFLKMLFGSRVEVDEFIRLLGVDICFDQKLEALNDKADEYESLCDAYHSVVCEAINIIDEALEKPRLNNARGILKRIRSTFDW